MLDTTNTLSNQRNLFMVKGTDRILCVFEDTRDSATYGVDIYGVWLDLDGHPIDQRAFVIANDYGDQLNPRVAYGDGRFFVTWFDMPPIDRSPYWYIKGREVYSNGAITPIHTFVVDSVWSFGGTSLFSVVFTSGIFVLFWWRPSFSWL